MRKTYTIKHRLTGEPEIWDGLHDKCENGDLMNKRNKMNQSIIHFKAIGLEVLNLHIIVQLSVFQLETTRGPRKNGDGEKYHYTKNS